MSRRNDPYRGEKRTYIPNDEIDREEKADIRQQKKGNIVNVLLGGLIVISLIAFLFVVLDSGILSGAGAQPMYGSPSSADGSGGSQVTGELTQEQKKAAEEEARKAEEEAKQKKREEEEAKRAEEEAARKAKEEARKKAEEKKKKEQEEKKAAEEQKKALEEEQRVLAGDYILPDSADRKYSREELERLTDKEVLFALNEIYARRGRIFTGEEFKRYFESKSWYRGTIPAEEFDANQNERFNDTERANINKLVRIAEERGLR